MWKPLACMPVVLQRTSKASCFEPCFENQLWHPLKVSSGNTDDLKVQAGITMRHSNRILAHRSLRILTRRAVCSLVALVVSVLIPLSSGSAQVPREPDYEAMKNSDQDSQNKQAAERLQQEKENKYRGGASSFSEVKQKMEEQMAPILLGKGGDIDKWYSPHLRDILIKPPERALILPYRYKAGAPVIIWIPILNCYFCLNGVGTRETACTMCQPAPVGQGCPGQKWLDKHITPTCCYKNTQAYQERDTDANFKACCVLKAEKNLNTEEIACLHGAPGGAPPGDGWSGLFEYYYPTTVVAWENSRDTTMFADKQEVNQCLKDTREILHGDKGVSWVEKAIKKNLEVADKLEGGSGKTDTSQLKPLIQEAKKSVDQIEQKNQVADSMAGEGLTMRVNFPAMAQDYREKLAKHFCMHPKQFMKLMNPAEDSLQREGGTSEDQLKKIPIWANYCKQGTELMTNPDETMQCKNVDGTPTDFQKGMQAWNDDPLFCQRMNLSNSKMQELFGEVLAKSNKPKKSEAEVGYTCRNGGKLNGSMVPVELYRNTPVERRTAISDHVLGFLIAGGIYKPMTDGAQQFVRSFYKRFEPRPYSLKLGMFVGEPFKGASAGPTNELDMPCESVTPREYQGKNMSDQLFISDKTHPTQAFKGDTEVINNLAPEEFNRYVEEWGKGGEGKTLPKRGLDDKLANSAAAFRIFATCPAGHVRWHPPDIHDVVIQTRCGYENFGGETPKGP